ncbi:hypothetical protein AAKU67_001225 [Oxalobacteraceae bacterium GrIS 2.11]
MENLHIKATPNSPEVDFRFDTHTLSMKGESYPENAAAFFSPIADSTRHYLEKCSGTRITVNISLAYFNSSSTKMLFSFFNQLNQAALAGNHVQLNWFYHEDDDSILEFGEELRADFTALEFRDCPLGNI